MRILIALEHLSTRLSLQALVSVILCLVLMIPVLGLSAEEELPPLFPFLISYDGPANASSMAHLLDVPAGKQGFIRVENGHFVDNKGMVRLHATNLTGPANFPTHEAADKVAARLARFGINCVRLHYFDAQYGNFMTGKEAGIFGNDDALPKAFSADPTVPLLFAPEQVDRQDYLIAALKNDDRWVRRAAAGALGKVGDTRAVEPLITALKDDDKDVRSAAVHALGELKDPRAIEPLIGAFGDRENVVREAAGATIVKIGSPAVEFLITALKNDDSSVREMAVQTLGKLKDVRAVESLIATLRDESYSVSSEGVKALCNIGSVNAIQPLIAMLADDDQLARVWAKDVLVSLYKQGKFDEQTKQLILSKPDTAEIIRPRISKPSVIPMYSIDTKCSHEDIGDGHHDSDNLGGGGPHSDVTSYGHTDNWY